jgi:hypothetical protein
MKTILFAALTLISTSAHAGQYQLDFTFFGHSAGSDSMVACDYAESQAQTLVALFGGINIETSCTGGISSVGIFPLNLSVSYDLGNTGVSKTAEFNSDTWSSNCTFNTGMVRKFLPNFINVNVVSKNDNCWDATTKYSYTFQVQY